MIAMQKWTAKQFLNPTDLEHVEEFIFLERLNQSIVCVAILVKDVLFVFWLL